MSHTAVQGATRWESRQQQQQQEAALGPCKRPGRLKLWRGIACSKHKQQFTATVWVKDAGAAKALGAGVVMFRWVADMASAATATATATASPSSPAAL